MKSTSPLKRAKIFLGIDMFFSLGLALVLGQSIANGSAGWAAIYSFLLALALSDMIRGVRIVRLLQDAS